MFSIRSLLVIAALILGFSGSSAGACPFIPPPFTMCTHDSVRDRYYIVGQGPKATGPAILKGNWIVANFPNDILWVHRDLKSVIQLQPKFLTTGVAENGKERILFLQDYNANSMTMKEVDVNRTTKYNLATVKVDFLNKNGGIVGSGEWAIQPRCGTSQGQYFVDLSNGNAASITAVRITGRGGNWLGNTQCF